MATLEQCLAHMRAGALVQKYDEVSGTRIIAPPWALVTTALYGALIADVNPHVVRLDLGVLAEEPGGPPVSKLDQIYL